MDLITKAARLLPTRELLPRVKKAATLSQNKLASLTAFVISMIGANGTDLAIAQNTMGNIIENRGIITQGQIGDNYIIQSKSPAIKIVESLPPVQNPDGTFKLQLVFRIISQFPANNLFVAVKKEDIAIPPNTKPMPIMLNFFNVWPRGGGSQTVSIRDDRVHGYILETIQTPRSGEYVLTIIARSKKVKPRIQIGIQ